MTTLNLTEFTKVIPQLPAQDQDFAKSLATQWGRKGSLSDRQLFWVDKLEKRLQEAEDQLAQAECVLGEMIDVYDAVGPADTLDSYFHNQHPNRAREAILRYFRDHRESKT